MTLRRTSSLFLASLLLAAVGCTDSAPPAEEDPTPPADEPAAPFKSRLVQLPDRLMWINSDLTEQEFEALSPGPGWNKMALGEAQADEDSFNHSPDSQTEGEFTEQQMHEVTWAYIAKIVEFRTPVDEAETLFLNVVEQYRQLRFLTDRSVSILESDAGVQYIRINRDPNRSSNVATLPEGWTVHDVLLSEDLVVDVAGESQVLLDSIDDRYLGPLEPPLEL